jgi:hypothetical protein
MFKPTEAEFAAKVGHFFPPEALTFVFNIFNQENFILKITPPRVKKKGDFRPPRRNRILPLITINNDLSPYEFLEVYLHEVAHHMTSKWYQRGLLPHGIEWQNEYRQLFQELLSTVALPKAVRNAFESHLIDIKRSSNLDLVWYELFYKDEINNPNELLVRELQPNDLFLCQKKVFRFDSMVRTRALCTLIQNNDSYLVAGHAKVRRLIN